MSDAELWELRRLLTDCERERAREAVLADSDTRNLLGQLEAAERRIAAALGYVGGFGCDSCVRKDRALTGGTE